MLGPIAEEYTDLINKRTELSKDDLTVTQAIHPINDINSLTDHHPDEIHDAHHHLLNLHKEGLLPAVNYCVITEITNVKSKNQLDFDTDLSVGRSAYFIGDADTVFFWNIFLAPWLRNCGLGRLLFELTLDTMPPRITEAYTTISSPDGRDLLSGYNPESIGNEATTYPFERFSIGEKRTYPNHHRTDSPEQPQTHP